MRDVIQFYPGDEFNILRGQDTLDFTKLFSDPYVMFFSCRRQLDACLDGDYPEEAKTHLNVLLDFLKTEHPVWSAKLTEIEEGRCKAIAFHSLWLLYPPGTSVYACKGVDDRQMVVYSRDVSFSRHKKEATQGPKGPITVRCWDVKYDHGAFRRTFSDVTIEPYSGEKVLSSLPLVPAQYLPNEKEMRARLISRGRKYYQLKQSAQLSDYYGDRFPRVYNDVGTPV